MTAVQAQAKQSMPLWLGGFWFEMCDGGVWQRTRSGVKPIANRKGGVFILCHVRCIIPANDICIILCVTKAIVAM